MTEAELRERIARLAYGMFGEPWRNPSQVEHWHDFADAVLAEIAAAGFAVVRADQLLWLQQANYHGPQWAAEHPLPERTDGE